MNPPHYGFGWRMGGIRYAENEEDEPELLSLISHGGSRPVTGVAANVMRDFLRFKNNPQY